MLDKANILQYEKSYSIPYVQGLRKWQQTQTHTRNMIHLDLLQQK